LRLFCAKPRKNRRKRAKKTNTDQKIEERAKSKRAKANGQKRQKMGKA
jgi:hypothetical protein